MTNGSWSLERFSVVAMLAWDWTDSEIGARRSWYPGDIRWRNASCPFSSLSFERWARIRPQATSSIPTVAICLNRAHSSTGSTTPLDRRAKHWSTPMSTVRTCWCHGCRWKRCVCTFLATNVWSHGNKKDLDCPKVNGSFCWMMIVHLNNNETKWVDVKEDENAEIRRASFGTLCLHFF